MESVGFIGLGVMGAPMAGHLMRAGHPLVIWSRTPGRVEPLREAGAHVAESPADLARQAEVVFLCVNRSEDVREVVEALEPGLSSGQVVVDHSTIAPSEARALHRRLAERGIAFVDAPVTGGSMGAREGKLTIFCGGRREDFERVAPILAAYAKRAEHVGGPGMGQMMKLANQIAVAGSLLGLCESLAFAQAVGLDLAQTRELLAGGAAGSWAFDHYGPKILARDWSPGFSIRNQRKDFAYAREVAEELGLEIPGTLLVDRLLGQLEAEGRSEDTTAALFDVLARGRGGA